MIKLNNLVSFLGWLLAAGTLLLSGCGVNARTISTPKAATTAVVVDPAALALERSAPLPRQLKFESFSLPPGLHILSMRQDKQGYLWLGTEEAFYRYDGYNFKPYSPSSQERPVVELGKARQLFEDHAGRLWAITEKGLVRFDPVSGNWDAYPQGGGPGQLGSNPITGLAEDKAGDLWVGTDGGGLYRIEPESGQVTRYGNRAADPASLRNDGVLALTRGLDEEIWVSTRARGLDRLDPTTSHFTHFDIPKTQRDNPDPLVYAMVVDPTGDLWLAVKGGLLGFDPQLGSFTFFSHPASETGQDLPSALVLDQAGNFWLGTNGAGLYRFSPRNGEWAHYQNDPNDAYSLSQDQVTGLLLDHTGILWIQFLNGEVDRFDPRAGFRIYQQARGNPNSLSGNAVTSVLMDSAGDWWIGTQDSGLSRYEPKVGRWTQFRHDPNRPNSLSDDQVTALAEDAFGRIWVGTLSNGINRFDPESGRWTTYTPGPDSANAPSDKSIRSLLAGQDGRIWVGAGDGILNQLEPETGRFRQLPPPDPLNAPGDPNRMSLGITAIVEDPSKYLWLGTESGQLFRFDLGSETWKRYPVTTNPGNEKPTASVTSLWLGEGRLWVGTRQSGLFGFDPASETFSKPAGVVALPGKEIASIIGDGQGTLWLSTENGLVHYTPADGKALLFHTADGLPSDNFISGAAFRSPAGELFFGSDAGLLVFFPESVRPNPYVPPVVITDLQLLYEAVPQGPGTPWQHTAQGDEIHLGYSQNVFTFEYAALDFANPEENQYAYQLEGFDPDWVQAGSRRQASYTSLEPGNYVFRVRGSNNAGVWNEAGVSIPVVIQPPFWLTGWFRLLVAGLALAMVTSGIGLRLRAVNRQKRELVRQVEERTAELKQALQELEASREVAERAAVLEERQRLARELHDSVTQLLYGQVLSADISAKYLQKGDLKALAENLVRLREIAGQSLKEMRLLLYELRPTSFEEEGLVHALDLRLDAVERRSRIESTLEVKGLVELPPQVAWEVYRVAIEALNNSLKHASATEVAVRLSRENGTVQLEVQDNGSGFEVNGAERGGFGILSMRQRAEGIGGRLAIESNPGRGTCVKLEIPVDQKDELDHGGEQ